MHDQLLQALSNVATVRLVASYTDNELQFPNGNSIQVLIPDMHLLSAARRTLYTYGTNYEGAGDTSHLLQSVVTAIAQLKMDAAAANQRVVVFVMGDYLDLWRECLLADLNDEVIAGIRNSHQQLLGLLEDPALNTHFLLGNHDFELYRFPSYNAWERRFFIPGDDPTIVLMHGDYFDWVEQNIPEDLRDIAVYLFSEPVEPGKAILGKMADLNKKYNSTDYSTGIELTGPAPLGSMQNPSRPCPPNHNLQSLKSSPPAATKFLESACRECANMNASSGSHLRMVIIGHTHHARIATMSMPDGTPFALVDTGAWIESCAEAEGGTAIPNSQITAISANQVRIYQLAPHA